MKRVSMLFIKTLIISTILIVAVSGTILADDNSIEVALSPNVLAINSNGGSVSLHADIKYSLVKETSLTVNGLDMPIADTFADDRGDLVVKCDIGILEDRVSEGTATFELTVITADDEYTGTDTIKVALPKGK